MSTRSFFFAFQSSFQFGERDELAALEFPDPTLADLMDRHRVEIVQLLAAVLVGRDEVGLLENDEVLGHGLTRHVEAVAQLVQRLSVLVMKPVEQGPPRGIRQCFEDFLHGSDNRQPNGCMSSADVWRNDAVSEAASRKRAPGPSRRHRASIEIGGYPPISA